jgi:steroid delta-isomerase-like uncharacterized protein
MKSFYLPFVALALATPLAAQAANDVATPFAAAKAAVPNPEKSDRAFPKIVQEWADAWNTGNGDRMATLFATDGMYQDFSLGYSFKGRAEVAKFVQESIKNVVDLHVNVTDAFRAGNRVALRFVFSGHVNGAPKAFSVPVLTVMELKGDKISYDGDYYNRLEVLRQSGLPTN